MKYLVLVCLLQMACFTEFFGQSSPSNHHGCSMGFSTTGYSQSTKFDSNSQDMLNKIRLIGVNTDSVFSYGYKFLNKDSLALGKLGKALIKKGYTLVRLEYLGRNQSFILDVEKIEKHSAKTLSNREHELMNLCKKYKIDTYDGWSIHIDERIQGSECIDKTINIIRSKKNEELFDYAKSINSFVFFEYARVAFDSCIHRGIKLDSSHFYLANCLVVRRETEQQILHYEKAIEINPLFFDAYLKLGWVYCNDEQYDKSLMCFSKTTVLNSKNSDGFYGLAYAQYKINNLKDSKINCDTALQLDPNNENALILKKMLKGK